MNGGFWKPFAANKNLVDVVETTSQKHRLPITFRIPMLRAPKTTWTLRRDPKNTIQCIGSLKATAFNLRVVLFVVLSGRRGFNDFIFDTHTSMICCFKISYNMWCWSMLDELAAMILAQFEATALRKYHPQYRAILYQRTDCKQARLDEPWAGPSS